MLADPGAETALPCDCPTAKDGPRSTHQASRLLDLPEQSPGVDSELGYWAGFLELSTFVFRIHWAESSAVIRARLDCERRIYFQ